MDILSHGLWAAGPFYRKSRKSFWIAFLFGVLPDLVAFVPHMFLMILGPERHIPTHSIKFFATPFLWPLSNFRVDGVSWSNPKFLVWNYALLVSVYVALTFLRRKSKLVPQAQESAG